MTKKNVSGIKKSNRSFLKKIAIRARKIKRRFIKIEKDVKKLEDDYKRHRWV